MNTDHLYEPPEASVVCSCMACPDPIEAGQKIVIMADDEMVHHDCFFDYALIAMDARVDTASTE